VIDRGSSGFGRREDKPLPLFRRDHLSVDIFDGMSQHIFVLMLLVYEPQVCLVTQEAFGPLPKHGQSSIREAQKCCLRSELYPVSLSMGDRHVTFISWL
jgi:hypothetical protein